MARRLSDETKKKRKMGTGEGKDYIPYITTSEINSLGTTSVIRDWKTGRGVHCLSQGEALWYYILRWDDNNVDIREQYPLDVDKTVELAKEMGIKHPQNEKHVMTTDFLVTESDGTLHAYSVKADRNLSKRTLQLLCLEKMYWVTQNVQFKMLFKTEVDEILAGNIRLVTELYDKAKVTDWYSNIKHQIAVKRLNIDLSSEPLTIEYVKRCLHLVENNAL
jgi:putative uncharacterized protein (fragment)